jgi:hypothetical protein
MNLSSILPAGFRTSAVILALMSTVAATPLFSQDLTVCVDVRATLDAGTMRAFGEELQAIARLSGLSLRLLNRPSECQDIRLTIQSIAPSEISALGAARVKDGRILPEIEIYATSVATLMRSRLPALVGRGMARVAAHEIGHYLLQTTSHSKGLMTEYYAAPHLLVKDNRAFRIPSRATPERTQIGMD